MNVTLICSAILLARMRRRQQKSKKKLLEIMQRKGMKSRKPSSIPRRICDLKRTRHNQAFLEDLRSDPHKCAEYFQMSPSSFDELLVKLAPTLRKKNTRLRYSIPPEERLMVALRYLSSGMPSTVVAKEFKMGVSTISCILQEVCGAVWNIMKAECLPEPTTGEWLGIAKKFERKANFPNCAGALISKRIIIQRPQNSGDVFVWWAVVDADCCFVAVDVVLCRRSRDSNVLNESISDKILKKRGFNLPGDRKIVDNAEPLPYVFAGDEAFSLDVNVMTPYPTDAFNKSNRIYNYRLGRVRRYAESAFAIFASRWSIIHSPKCDQYIAESVIKACFVLHNFVLRREGENFEHNEESVPYNLELFNIPVVQPSEESLNVREKFAEYFASEEGSVPWQNNYI